MMSKVKAAALAALIGTAFAALAHFFPEHREAIALIATAVPSQLSKLLAKEET